jgi:hypothetical protein
MSCRQSLGMILARLVVLMLQIVQADQGRTVSTVEVLQDVK